MTYFLDYFEPLDFSYWPRLERKIYKIFNGKTTKYIYANNKENGVRMLLFKTNEDKTLYYCINSKEISVIPKLVEKDGEDVLKEKYTVCEEINEDKTNVDFFMDNLGKNDIVRTHNHAIVPDEIPDNDIKKILKKYFD